MLAPQPGQNRKFPRPAKLLSKSVLELEWKLSRDSTSNSGSRGTDNVTALQFASKLDSNLSELSKLLRDGKFGFSTLRAVFIPKPDSDKERVICIPTVRDRLVQRAIVRYITSKRKFPIYNASSFGFIKGVGTSDAINRVIALRTKYDWCLKTDIEAFFDRIPRKYLKKCVYDCLGAHSLTPLIWNAIDCEAKITPENKLNFAKQGIKKGLGVRQGMPLSPLLANLVLSNFDRQIAKQNIDMVRYADDLVLFFDSKDDAEEGRKLVGSLLSELQLSIPKIGENSKTKIISKSDPLPFLGREIVYLGKASSFVAKVSSKQITKIKTKLGNEYSLAERLKSKKTFHDTILELTRSISAYLGIYKDAYNFEQFSNDMRGQSRAITLRLLEDLFGQKPLTSLSSEGRKFLGIEVLDSVKPNSELDV